MNRPDAAQLAKWSYYLSFATSGSLALGFLLGFVRSPLSAILWLGFLTSAVGAFMAWAAKSELKQRPNSDPTIASQVRQGWRVNFGGFMVLVLILIFLVVVRILFSQFNEPIVDPSVTPAGLLLFGL